MRVERGAVSTPERVPEHRRATYEADNVANADVLHLLDGLDHLLGHSKCCCIASHVADKDADLSRGESALGATP